MNRRKTVKQTRKEVDKLKKAYELLGPHTQEAITERLSNPKMLFPTSKRVPKDFIISLLCTGQIFGHDDLIKMRNYSTTVRCMSSIGTLYIIKGAEFFQKLGRDDRTWSILTELSSF